MSDLEKQLSTKFGMNAADIEYVKTHGRIYDIKNGRGWKHVVIDEAAKLAAGLDNAS